MAGALLFICSYLFCRLRHRVCFADFIKSLRGTCEDISWMTAASGHVSEALGNNEWFSVRESHHQSESFAAGSAMIDYVISEVGKTWCMSIRTVLVFPSTYRFCLIYLVTFTSIKRNLKQIHTTSSFAFGIILSHRDV